MLDFQASLQILFFSQWARQSQYKAFNTATDTDPFVPNIISIKWNLVHLSHLVDIESPADSTVQLSSMKILEKGESFSKLNRNDLLRTANLLLLFMGIYKLNKGNNRHEFLCKNKHSKMVISSARYRQHKISIKLHCSFAGRAYIHFPVLQKELIL